MRGFIFHEGMRLDYKFRKIPLDSILVETKSLDTIENIKYAHKLMANMKEPVHTIYIFADTLHAIRVKILLKSYGYRNIKIVKSSIMLDFKTIIQELVLITFAYFDPTGTKLWPMNKRLAKERERRKRGKAYLSYKE